MKGFSLNGTIIRLALLMAVVAILGCSSDDATNPLPSEKYTLTLTSEGGTFDIAEIDTKIDFPIGSLFEGVTVPVVVELMPANLPIRGVAGSIHERIGWISVEYVGDTTMTLTDSFVVCFPLNGEYIANENYTLFFYDRYSGTWMPTGKTAVVTDTGTHAIFSASAFGTYGVFKGVPLRVDATASRTTGKAPTSINLTAVIDGGAPPYSVLWWFGDDKDPEAGVSVSHFYELPITYTAACVVVDQTGREVSDYIDLDLR